MAQMLCRSPDYSRQESSLRRPTWVARSSGGMSATLQSSSNKAQAALQELKPEKPAPSPGWQQLWATLKSSTKRWLGLDDEGLQ